MKQGVIYSTLRPADLSVLHSLRTKYLRSNRPDNSKEIGKCRKELPKNPLKKMPTCMLTSSGLHHTPVVEIVSFSAPSSLVGDSDTDQCSSALMVAPPTYK